MPRITQPIVQVTDPRIKTDIRAILKILMADHDRISEMPRKLVRADMALDMRDQEGALFEAIQWCSDKNVPPLPENVIRYLETTHRAKLDDPRVFVETLVKEHEQDTQGLRMLSNIVEIWLKERSLAATGEGIAAIANDPMLGYEEKWESAFSMLNLVSPADTFIYEEMSEADFMELSLRENERVYQLRQSGMDIGPMFPFESVKAYLSYLEWGQVTMMIGGTGNGKTSVAEITGENIAWNQKLKTDVVYFALETPLEILSRRQFCRYNLLDYEDIKTASIRLKSDKWKNTWDHWVAFKAKKNNTEGYIRHFYSPEASVSDLISAMMRSAEVSLALGHNIVWIIDHLHSIDWQKTHGYMSEFDAQRSIFRMLSGAANKISQRVKNHLIILGQEGDTRGQMFGGKFAAKRAQLVMTIERERFGDADPNTGKYPRADHNYPITMKDSQITQKQKDSGLYERDTKDKTIWYSLDASGKRRYWYRIGDEASHKMTFASTKGNDSALGFSSLLFEARLHRVTQDPEQVQQLIKDGLLPPAQVA